MAGHGSGDGSPFTAEQVKLGRPALAHLETLSPPDLQIGCSGKLSTQSKETEAEATDAACLADARHDDARQRGS